MIKFPIDITDSSGTKPKTSSAVTYRDGYVYLSYADQWINLFRITRDKAGDWGSHKKLVPGANPDPSSQMTAIGANGTIHLFYQAQDNKKMNHYREKSTEK